MIKQRRGHIVGVSSLTIKCPFYSATTYIATKFGNKGFIDALRLDMDFYGFSDFIKFTTAIPGFINTNEKFLENLSNFNNYILNSNEPDFVADRIIDGVLKDCENVYVSKFEIFISWLFNLLPTDVKNVSFKNIIKNERREQYMKMRLKQCKLIQDDNVVY
jgi:short-subunit dehydrogenase